MIEIGVAMIVCCLPSLAPLLDMPELGLSLRFWLSRISLTRVNSSDKQCQQNVSVSNVTSDRYIPTKGYESNTSHEQVVAVHTVV